MSWDNIDFDAFYAEVKASHREEALTPEEGWLTVESCARQREPAGGG